MSGISNWGMLLWNIAAQVPDGFGFATFNTIAASPQLGFALPTFANWQKFSFIDMHGLEDITIPTNLNSAYGPRWFSFGICKYKAGYKSHDLL